MKQKLLFLVFTADACTQNHAFMYALECRALGHEVRLILEGAATTCLNRLAEGGKFSLLFQKVKDGGLLEGACKTASGGCSTNEKDRDVAKLAEKEGLKLIADLDGHAGIGRFIEGGYQVMVF